MATLRSRARLRSALLLGTLGALGACARDQPFASRLVGTYVASRPGGFTTVTFLLDGTAEQYSTDEDRGAWSSSGRYTVAGDTAYVTFPFAPDPSVSGEATPAVLHGDSLVVLGGGPARPWVFVHALPDSAALARLAADQAAAPHVGGPAARGGAGAPPDTSAYFAFQVDRHVDVDPPTVQPKYPAALRRSEMEGEVAARFIVDTLGRVEPASFRALSASHRYFEAAVREALPRMHYLPAELHGQKVRQWVEQTFAFKIE